MQGSALHRLGIRILDCEKEKRESCERNCCGTRPARSVPCRRNLCRLHPCHRSICHVCPHRIISRFRFVRQREGCSRGTGTAACGQPYRSAFRERKHSPPQFNTMLLSESMRLMSEGFGPQMSVNLLPLVSRVLRDSFALQQKPMIQTAKMTGTT
jgi:hypothetical protein